VNRTLRTLGLLFGVALLVWLVARADVVALFGVFPRIGWGFLLILAARAATIAIDAAAWSCLLPAAERPPFRLMLALRWIAESINTTLPAAQVGGEIVRAHLLQQRITAPARGAASVAVDFALSLFAQILFTLLGFVLLAWLGNTAGWWWAAFSAMLVPTFALLAWELLVRQRLLAAAQRGPSGCISIGSPPRSRRSPRHSALSPAAGQFWLCHCLCTSAASWRTPPSCG